LMSSFEERMSRAPAVCFMADRQKRSRKKRWQNRHEGTEGAGTERERQEGCYRCCREMLFCLLFVAACRLLYVIYYNSGERREDALQKYRAGEAIKAFALYWWGAFR